MKVTPIVQVAPPAIDVVQGVMPVAVPAKSAELPPVVVGGRVRPMADPVLFVIVTYCGCEVAPTSCVPKLMFVGATLIVGVSVKSATNAFEFPAEALNKVWYARVVVGKSDVPAWPST